MSLRRQTYFSLLQPRFTPARAGLPSGVLLSRSLAATASSDYSMGRVYMYSFPPVMPWARAALFIG